MVKFGLKISIIVLFLVSLVILTGCESDAQTGALVGTLAGAGIGQLAGGDTKATLIGAGVGAGAGYVVGSVSDKNKEKESRTSSSATTTETVWITNSNGSRTPVNLTKQGTGYVGPKGEYYDRLPTSDELKPVYGF
jgi:hypothetical protein